MDKINVLHVSEVYNRKSILKKGLLPTLVKNETHKKAFQEQRLVGKNGKGIYTWQDCYENEKFVRDLIYSKIWIHPRNELMEDAGDRLIDFKYDIPSEVFLCPQLEMVYDVYIANVYQDESLYNEHMQEPSDNPYHSTYNMDDAYSHSNKKLHIFNKPLDVSLIGQAYMCYNNNKINIKVLNNITYV